MTGWQDGRLHSSILVSPGRERRLAAEFESVPADGWDAGSLPDDLAALLDGVFLESVPGACRILRGLEDRGWTGWTNVRPVDRAR